MLPEFLFLWYLYYFILSLSPDIQLEKGCHENGAWLPRGYYSNRILVAIVAAVLSLPIWWKMHKYSRIITSSYHWVGSKPLTPST